jgi:hypothetical protein
VTDASRSRVFFVQCKPDDRTTLKLNELRKVFEQSLLRLEKQSARREEAVREVVGAHAAKGTDLGSAVAHASSAAAAASASTSSPFARSILTSSLDLRFSRESVGQGSVGLFSPLRANTITTRMVTRTGAVDQEAVDRDRARTEHAQATATEPARDEERRSKAEEVERLVRSHPSRSTNDTPRQPRGHVLASDTPATNSIPPRSQSTSHVYAPPFHVDSHPLTSSQLR